MSKFQYKISTKWWCYYWLGLNLLKPYTFLGIIPKMSQTKFHHIRISKAKVILFKLQYQNERKRKSGKKCSGLQNAAIKGLQIGAGFGDYKLGQEGLQIGASLGISNRGKKITSRGRDYKSGQGLQIGAEQ